MQQQSGVNKQSFHVDSHINLITKSPPIYNKKEMF